jgi:hypothetical protein
MDALKSIPTIKGRLKTKRGDAILQKTDIFKRMMWFGIVGEEAIWIPVSCDRVAEIVELNKKGIIPESFEDLNPDAPAVEKPTLSELNSDLERMDKKYGSVKSGNRTNRNNRGNRDGGNRSDRGPRPPRPEGENRGPRPENGPRPERGPRPEGQDRGPRPPRPEGENRGPRPDGTTPTADGTATPKPFKKKKKLKPRPPRDGAAPTPEA